jgi:hypothetical protein
MECLAACRNTSLGEFSPSARWSLELAEKLNNYLNILRIGKSSRLHLRRAPSSVRCDRPFGKMPRRSKKLRESNQDYFVALVEVEEEDARPVTTPMASPPRAPASNPTITRKLTFSRIEPLRPMAEPSLFNQDRILTRSGRKNG